MARIADESDVPTVGGKPIPGVTDVVFEARVNEVDTVTVTLTSDWRPDLESALLKFDVANWTEEMRAAMCDALDATE